MPPEPLTTTVALSTAGAWLWDKYGEAVTSKAANDAKDRWKRFKWKDAAASYRRKIKKLYGTMQIMGMAKPVPLDDIFTEAYMLDKPTAFGRFDIERLKQLTADPDAPPQNAERIGGLALVNGNENLFILGKPGAGKTTFLKYIAVQAAEPKKPLIDKVPIFVSLKEWADSGAELMDFITERFDICDFPDARPFVGELLKSGNAIVLFDGLDEVNQESGQRDKQTRAMNNFVEKYDRTQSLITCRVAATDYSFKPFTYVEVADFTPKQIEQFVHNWFRNEKGKRDEATSKKFLAEFARDDNKGLRELARTPLLLTLLCMAFDETLSIPPRRVDIYEEALDALLKKWDSSRRIKRDEVYRKLSLNHKENMLARIAAGTFERNEYFIPQKELERLITDYVKNVPPHNTDEATDGEVILKAIAAQHGIFIERAREIYSFSHLTFQEYFTARYIVDNAAKGTLTRLVKKHCADRRWREVFLLTTSLLPDASQFITTFRRTIDDALGNDKNIRAFMDWANRKSASAEGDPLLARPFYLYTPLFSSSIVFDLDLLIRVLFIYVPDIALDRNLVLALGLVRSHAKSPAPDRGLADALERTLSSATALKLNRLAKELSALLIPNDNTSASERRELADKFGALAIKHRDIGHEWGLTPAQELRLANYLNATRLLQDCLELAFMPPDEKSAILESLYVHPAHAGEGQGG